MISRRENTAALFITGIYYLLKGDSFTAEMCWKTAVEIWNGSYYSVGEV